MVLEENKTILITDSNLIFYYTNFGVDDGFLLIDGGEKTLFVDSRYYFSAKNIASCNVVLLEDINKVLSSIKSKSVGLYYEYTQTNFSKKLESMGFNIFDCGSLVESQTSIKTEKEINLIKKSCEIAEKSFIETLKVIKENVSELDVLAELEYNFKKFGAEKSSFDSIIAFSSNSSVPHYKTSNYKLKNNSVILMDFGCVYNGYCSDMTRTFYFGNASLEFKKAYDSCLNAHLNAYNNIQENTLGKTADSLAREILNKDGYGKFFTHSLGHGVGVKIHEMPRLSKTSNSVLKNGNVFSIEPGVYIDGEFGIRIEDTVCLKDGKCKSFMNFTKELFAI